MALQLVEGVSGSLQIVNDTGTNTFSPLVVNGQTLPMDKTLKTLSVSDGQEGNIISGKILVTSSATVPPRYTVSYSGDRLPSGEFTLTVSAQDVSWFNLGKLDVFSVSNLGGVSQVSLQVLPIQKPEITSVSPQTILFDGSVKVLAFSLSNPIESVNKPNFSLSWSPSSAFKTVSTDYIQERYDSFGRLVGWDVSVLPYDPSTFGKDITFKVTISNPSLTFLKGSLIVTEDHVWDLDTTLDFNVRVVTDLTPPEVVSVNYSTDGSTFAANSYRPAGISHLKTITSTSGGTGYLSMGTLQVSAHETSGSNDFSSVSFSLLNSIGSVVADSSKLGSVVSSAVSSSVDPRSGSLLYSRDSVWTVNLSDGGLFLLSSDRAYNIKVSSFDTNGNVGSFTDPSPVFDTNFYNQTSYGLFTLAQHKVANPLSTSDSTWYQGSASDTSWAPQKISGLVSLYFSEFVFSRLSQSRQGFSPSSFATAMNVYVDNTLVGTYTNLGDTELTKSGFKFGPYDTSQLSNGSHFFEISLVGPDGLLPRVGIYLTVKN